MLYGNNADYTGTAVIDGKSLGYTPEDSGDTILGGKIQFLNGAKLWTSNSSSNDYVGGNFISDDSSALFQKSDSGNLTLVGDNSQFTGDVLLNGGSTTFDKTSNTAFFGGDVALFFFFGSTGSIIGYSLIGYSTKRFMCSNEQKPTIC